MKPYYEHGGITIYHGDCREILPGISGDLLCTDPPYGIGESIRAHIKSGDVQGHGHRRVARRNYEHSDWDAIPMGGVDVNVVLACAPLRIVFGGNYFPLPPSSCWLVWDKLNGDNDFADCELAWTNLNKAVRRLCWLWNGFARANLEPRYDHPTQKPVPVMKWAIRQAPESCSVVVDPFCGSGSTLVAAKSLNRRAIGIEIEEKYCEISAKRLSQEVLQFEELGRMSRP